MGQFGVIPALQGAPTAVPGLMCDGESFLGGPTLRADSWGGSTSPWVSAWELCTPASAT